MRKLVLFCLSLYCLMIMMNALQAIPIADDYCNALYADRFGGFGYAAHLYQAWSGRFLTSLILSLINTSLSIQDHNLVIAFLALCLVFFQYQLARLTSRTESALLLAASACVTWFVYRTMLAKIVFWYTGGVVYMLCYALMPLFFQQFIASYRSEKMSLSLTILSLILANTLETIPPALICFMVGYSLFSEQGLHRKKLSYVFKISLLISLASLPLFLAPGNFARAATGQGLALSVTNLLAGYFKVAGVFFEAGINMILVSTCVGFLLSFLLETSSRGQRLRIGWSLLLSAIGSGLPLGIAAGFLNSRPASLFVLLASFAVMLLCSTLRTKSHSPKYQDWVTVALLSLTTVAVMVDVRRGQELRRQFLSRHALLTRERGSNLELVLEKFDGKFPRSLNSHDITSDPKNWMNYCVAQHYKVKSVRVPAQ